MTLEPVKVLLVDDREDNLVALDAMLRRDGVELLRAHSGREALDLMAVHHVSLALLDVMMPGMDGFELAELMRGAERTKYVPIIFITAGARDFQRVFKGYDSGAVDFLFKPIDPHILASKVAVFVDLARERQMLARSLRLNEMFVGILGHDLRNPLGAVIAGCELLASSAAEPRQQDILRRMTAAGHRMGEMIDQMLDLTRARLGDGLGFARTRTHVDIGAIVTRTIDELRATHSDRDIVCNGGDCTTIGDPERLLQLFSNLLGNAVTYASPGSRVTANVRCDGDSVVEIHNDGVIPPDVLSTVFEPFRKSRTSDGLGLGLYIAQQIASAHGGSIDVTSTPDAGTVFAVRLANAAQPHVVP